MQYIASCSFGKDSLAAIIECERRGIHIDKAIYVRVMFDENISAEWPEHEDFIYNKAIPLLKSRYDIETEILQADTNYCKYFYQVRGAKSANHGLIRGWPFRNGPWCNSRLKVSPIHKWKRTVREYTEVIGIAADETQRIEHKTNQGAFLPLVEWGITEAQCFDICRGGGLLSPAYNKGRIRLGCWFCHNSRIRELRRLRWEYPQLWARLLDMDKDSSVTYQPDKTLRDIDHRFAEEERQISFNFGEYKE